MFREGASSPGTVGDALPPVRRFLLVDIGRLLLLVVAAIALSFAGGAGANAASLQWDANGSTPGTGGSGTWNTSTALWFNGISFQAWSNAALDDAVFGGTAGTVTLGTSITAHSLGFNVTGYTVTGSTLTLGGVSPIISVVPFADAIIRSTLAGTAGLTVTGDGTLILTGASTYTGGTTISAGSTLQLGNATNAGSVAGDIVDNGVLVFNRSNAQTYAGAVSGSGTLSKIGTNTLTLTGANTYTGGTTISAGTLRIGNGATGSIAGDIVNNSALIFNRTGTLSYDGVISGSGSVTKSGTGTLTLTGNNTYTGVTTVSTAGSTLQAGVANAFSSASAHTVASGAFLDLFGFNQTIGSLAGAGRVTNAAAAAATLTTGGNDTSTTFSGVIQDGVGVTGLTKVGAGTFTLSGANTYTGATTVSAGTLQAGATNAFAQSSAFTVASGATLGLNNFNQTIGSLAGAGTVTNGGAATRTLTTGGDNTSTTFSGVIQNGAVGLTNLTKVGAGTFTLSGANTYTGVTTVSAGTLQAGATNAFAQSSAHTVASGAFLDLFGFNQTIGSLAGAGRVTNAAAAAATLTTGGNNTSTTFSGVIQDGVGVTGLTKVGAGTFTLTGANTYTGGTTISAGTLRIGNGATGSIAGDIVNNSALIFNRTGTLSYDGVISGSGSVTKSGTGTLTLTGNNTYTGVTTVSTAGSTLQAGVANAFSSASAHTVASGAFLDLFGFNQTIGSLAGAGRVTNAGSRRRDPYDRRQRYVDHVLRRDPGWRGSDRPDQGRRWHIHAVGRQHLYGRDHCQRRDAAGWSNKCLCAEQRLHGRLRRHSRAQQLQPDHRLARRRRHGDQRGCRHQDPHDRRRQYVDNVLRRDPEWRGRIDQPDQGRRWHTHAVRRQHLYGCDHCQRRHAAGWSNKCLCAEQRAHGRLRRVPGSLRLQSDHRLARRRRQGDQRGQPPPRPLRPAATIRRRRSQA